MPLAKGHARHINDSKSKLHGRIDDLGLTDRRTYVTSRL